MHIKEDCLRPILASVKRPSRYIGGEWGSGPVKEGRDMLRVCYAFPDVYEVGMSYLGFQILYGLTKKLRFADAERVYAPWTDMEEALRHAGSPLWSLESKRPLSEFDVIGFTLQYELSYSNMLTILDLGKVPFRSVQRGDEDPIVIAGGPGALAPEPVAPFIDAFCVGDGEIVLPELLEVLYEMKGRAREERLFALSKIGGVYVPQLPPDVSVRRRIAEDMDDVFYNTEMIVPNTGIVHDRAAIQVFKGCTRGCRFCQAGIIDRPVRERSVDSVVKQTELLLKNTGWEEVGLLSLATCDWTGLEELLSRFEPILNENHTKLSLPSLRMDAFSVDMAAGLESMRRGGLTFAPEAGTQRLRNVINKGVGEKDIESALEATFAHGWDRVKLYFMMGLPTETREDLSGILDICNNAVAMAKRYKRRGEVSVSLAGFVPKAHTPFQWEAQLDRDSMRERGRWVKNSVKNRKINLTYHEPEQTYIEGVFARGDASLADAIEEAWRRGARFDGWTGCFNFERWMEVFRDLEIDPDRYACRKRDINERLPWDHIDSGVTKAFLLSELTKAMKAELTPDCRDGCNGCGWQGNTKARGCGYGKD
jgi:radical SAM family uncharacterized protein